MPGPLTYLVGIDDAPATEAALRFAGALGARTGARLTGLRAVSELPLARSLAEQAELDHAAVDAARDAMRATVRRAGVELDAARVTTGDPAALLADEAHRSGASLVAVGVTHRAGLGRLSPGSVAERLIHGAPCTVAVVPAGPSDGPPDRIAVAWDGSAEADRALGCARELALALGASLTLVAGEDRTHVDPTLPGDVMLERFGQARATLAAALERRCETLDARLSPSFELVSGSPGPGIAAYCASGTDLLVTGSRGYGPLHAAIAGSTSRYLADHAACPTMIVPRGGARSLVWAAAPAADSAPAA